MDRSLSESTFKKNKNELRGLNWNKGSKSKNSINTFFLKTRKLAFELNYKDIWV